jgi:hypothetical protein
MGDYITLLQTNFNSAVYQETSTIPSYLNFNDATVYHKAYLASDNMVIYYSQTTNTIKYILVVDSVTGSGYVQVFDDKSFVATTFTSADFTISTCNASNTIVIAQ